MTWKATLVDTFFGVKFQSSEASTSLNNPLFQDSKLTMNPGLQHNQRGKLGDHSQYLEKTRMFERTAAQAQFRRIIPENCNGPLHSSHPNVIGPEKNRSRACSSDDSSFRFIRDVLKGKNPIGKSIKDERVAGNDRKAGTRQTGIHRESLSSTGTAVYRNLPLSAEPQADKSCRCLPVPNGRDAPNTMRSRRPLVNRRATPDFDSIEKEQEEDTDLTLNLMDVQFCDLAIKDSKITTLGRNSFISAWDPRTKQPTHSHFGSKDVHVLHISMVDLSCGGVSCLEDMKQEARLTAHLHHANICELQGVIREAK